MAGIDAAIVSDVVSVILQWRSEERRKQNRITAKRGDVIELFDHAFQITDTIAVRIAKRSRVDLIDNRAAPPIAHAQTVANGAAQIKRDEARAPNPMNGGSLWPTRRAMNRSMACGVVVTNLDCDTERMAHMRRELDSAGLLYERFRALRGEALPTDIARYFPVGVDLSPGEIGCYDNVSEMTIENLRQGIYFFKVMDKAQNKFWIKKIAFM